MSSRTLFFVLTTILLAIGLGWMLTPPLIIPPVEVTTPAKVYVMNQDFHSRLVLPEPDQSWVQYAYGDWQYFARYQQTIGTALQALFLPSQGALGRRVYPDIRALQQATESYSGSLISLTVDYVRVNQLRDQLNARFNRNIETVIVNPLNRMSFVQDDRHYTLLHNSNHEVVEWLEELDCRVEGFILWSGFRVQRSGE